MFRGPTDELPEIVIGHRNMFTQLRSLRFMVAVWHSQVAFDSSVDEAMRWNMIRKKLGHDIILQ